MSKGMIPEEVQLAMQVRGGDWLSNVLTKERGVRSRSQVEGSFNIDFCSSYIQTSVKIGFSSLYTMYIVT